MKLKSPLLSHFPRSVIIAFLSVCWLNMLLNYIAHFHRHLYFSWNRDLNFNEPKSKNEKWKPEWDFVCVCARVCVDYRLEESRKKAAVLLNDNLSALFSKRSTSFISLLSLSPTRPPLFSPTCTKHPSLGHSLPVPTRWLWQQSSSVYLFVFPFLSLSFSLHTLVSISIWIPVSF